MSIVNLEWPSGLPRFLWMDRECPRCSSIEFRSAEPGRLDKLFMVLALQPIRCVNCWRRYYSFRGTRASDEQ